MVANLGHMLDSLEREMVDLIVLPKNNNNT